MKLELQGSAITVMGRLEGMSKAEAWEQIKAGGGKVRKSLANSTDILVMGKMHYASDDEKNREKAKLNGTAVIDCAQFRVLLEEGELTVGGQEQVFEGEADIEESIGQFRGMFDESPSQETWQKICDLLDATHPDALDVVVDYVVSHLAPYEPDWSIKGYNIYRKRAMTPVFEPPEAWLQELFTGQYSAKFRIIKKVGLYDLKLTGKPTKSLIACPELHHLQQLDLGWNKLPHGFYTQLGKMAHLSGMTHMSFVNNPFERKAALGLGANDNFPKLKYLSLERCYFKDEGTLEALFGSGAFAALEELDIRHNDSISDEDLHALANASQLTNLRSLDLSLCRRLTHEGISVLLAAPHLSRLEDLKLAYNSRCENMGTIIANATHLPLKALNLRSTRLTDQDVDALANAPHLASLESCQFDELSDSQKQVIKNSPYLPAEACKFR